MNTVNEFSCGRNPACMHVCEDLLHISSSIGFCCYLRIRRLLSKYYKSAQLDQQQKKNSTHFVDCFSNPVGESGKGRFKLALSLVDTHDVNNSGFHH